MSKHLRKKKVAAPSVSFTPVEHGVLADLIPGAPFSLITSLYRLIIPFFAFK